jgi:hypothetical protein
MSGLVSAAARHGRSGHGGDTVNGQFARILHKGGGYVFRTGR